MEKSLQGNEGFRRITNEELGKKYEEKSPRLSEYVVEMEFLRKANKELRKKFEEKHPRSAEFMRGMGGHDRPVQYVFCARKEREVDYDPGALDFSHAYHMTLRQLNKAFDYYTKIDNDCWKYPYHIAHGMIQALIYLHQDCRSETRFIAQLEKDFGRPIHYDKWPARPNQTKS